jgi:hypothetical protein
MEVMYHHKRNIITSMYYWQYDNMFEQDMRILNHMFT